MSLVTLSDWEQRALEDIIAHPKSVVTFRRAQALLWLNAGESVTEVAARLLVNRRTIYNWAQRFRDASLSDILERLSEAPRSGRPRTALGVIEPLILSVIERNPREFGYYTSVWTALLLTRYLKEKCDITVSRESVRRAIARLNL